MAVWLEQKNKEQRQDRVKREERERQDRIDWEEKELEF